MQVLRYANAGNAMLFADGVASCCMGLEVSKRGGGQWRDARHFGQFPSSHIRTDALMEHHRPDLPPSHPLYNFHLQS
jgi:hypothetical protein